MRDGDVIASTVEQTAAQAVRPLSTSWAASWTTTPSPERMKGTIMQVRVDPLVCEANGVCVGLTPEVFDLDDDDRLHIIVPDPPADLLERVRHAVRSCPKAALTLDEN